MKTPSFNLSRGIAFLCVLFAFVSSAHAQWQTTAYTLRGGWNAIYLHGDASHATFEQHFAAHPEIVAVWRWNNNTTQVQFGVSPLIPTQGTPEWSIWKRDLPAETTLSNFIGQSAYLVECSGSSTTTYNVSITQRVMPPESNWVRNGATPPRLPDAQQQRHLSDLLRLLRHVPGRHLGQHPHFPLRQRPPRSLQSRAGLLHQPGARGSQPGVLV